VHQVRRLVRTLVVHGGEQAEVGEDIGCGFQAERDVERRLPAFLPVPLPFVRLLGGETCLGGRHTVVAGLTEGLGDGADMLLAVEIGGRLKELGDLPGQADLVDGFAVDRGCDEQPAGEGLFVEAGEQGARAGRRRR